MTPAGEAAPRRREVACGFQTRAFPLIRDGSSERVGRRRDLAQRYRPRRRPAYEDLSPCKFEVVRARLQQPCRDRERLLSHRFARERHRVARYHGRAACERPGAPSEGRGVAGGDRDVAHVHAQGVSDDLREHREVPLALRAHACCRKHLARRLDRDPASFVWTDAGSFDVERETQAQGAACLARFGLSLWPTGVVNHREGLAQHGRVVAAVVDERRVVLVDQAGVVGKLVGLYQVAPAHLGAVEPKLPRHPVHQPLHDEDTVGPACPTVGAHLGLVGEHRLELAAVGGDLVWADQRGAGDDGHDQAVGDVGAGIVEEHGAHAQNPARAVHRDLNVVNLLPLLVGGHEVLAPVLDPLDRPAQPHRGQRHQDLLGVEHHDLGPKPAAYVRRDHPHVVLGEAEQPCQPVADRNWRLR